MSDDTSDKDQCDEVGCCKHLLERLGDGGKGFKAEHTIQRSTGEKRFLGVSYKTSAKDVGLMLNWCPFCGGTPGYFVRDFQRPDGQADSSSVAGACHGTRHED